MGYLAHSIYIQESFNKLREFFDGKNIYHKYEGHSINKGIFLPEEGSIIYTRFIQ